ncbi:hypothetical protein FVR03_22015 [Pontibacter qinzhouensis]|uniref:Uncharacterized protein n=1 Tax=Pontibacter qinzhouensis TaxID=2603253 RepID=A0A5C8IYE7_9BACT|nr:hypothetical protein [Pontibacter qinzhouensis]TXK26209.1 hypothetical protein FVR03_22015 [Pontibacter qinzhouensis]
MSKTIVPILLFILLGYAGFAQTMQGTPVPAPQDTLQHQSENIDQWKRDLLGQYAETERLTANTIRPAYIHLVETARTKRSNWNKTDWEHAKAVLKDLNDRKSALGSSISKAENNRISALQEDFSSLQSDVEM